MQMLADQDVWQKTVDVLRNAGHDVVTARALGLASADDRTLLDRAAEEGRILLTRDKDFGTLVFLEEHRTRGVIFLRITPSSLREAHATFADLVEAVGEEVLERSFCVVEPGRYRVRRLPPRSSDR